MIEDRSWGCGALVFDVACSLVSLLGGFGCVGGLVAIAWSGWPVSGSGSAYVAAIGLAMVVFGGALCRFGFFVHELFRDPRIEATGPEPEDGG